MKIWILFLHWSKCIPINLKRTPKTFNGKFEGLYAPHNITFFLYIPMWKNYHFRPKSAIKQGHGSVGLDMSKHLIPFRLLWMHFDHDEDKIQIFNFWPFPKAIIGGLRWRWSRDVTLRLVLTPFKRVFFSVGFTRLNGVFAAKIGTQLYCCNAIFNFTTILLSFYVCNKRTTEWI